MENLTPAVQSHVALATKPLLPRQRVAVLSWWEGAARSHPLLPPAGTRSDRDPRTGWTRSMASLGFPTGLTSRVTLPPLTHSRTSLGLPQCCKLQTRGLLSQPLWDHTWSSDPGQGYVQLIHAQVQPELPFGYRQPGNSFAPLPLCLSSAPTAPPPRAPQMSPGPPRVVVLFIESIGCAIKPGVYSPVAFWTRTQ